MPSEFLTNETLKLIRPRKEDSSKGDFGTLLMLCGCENMTGAAYLSATAAMRCGVGLVRFCGNRETLAKMQRILYEPVFVPIEELSAAGRTAFLCGCGIGRVYDEHLTDILENCDKTAILDADCINFLAMHMDVLGRIKCEKILTPHPAEMSRLTGKSVAEIQSAREETASGFAKKHGCVLVLKGSGTVVAAPDGKTWVNTSGSSALAKGGSGDVLAGVIASLAAQGYSATDAARLGVYIHGLAADRLAEVYGKSGVLPSDLPMEIGRIMG